MHWLPLVVSFAVAAAIAPATIRSLAAQGMVRENYRGARVAFPAGIAIVTTVVAFNLIGDAMRDAFEVRLQKR